MENRRKQFILAFLKSLFTFGTKEQWKYLLSEWIIPLLMLVILLTPLGLCMWNETLKWLWIYPILATCFAIGWKIGKAVKDAKEKCDGQE